MSPPLTQGDYVPRAISTLIAGMVSNEHGTELSPLQRLAVMKDNLPRQNVRWQTEPGMEFLDLLFQVWDDGTSIRDIARTLDYSDQAVRNLLKHGRGQRRPWPTRQEAAVLREALQSAKPDPSDDSYLPAHEALMRLMSRYALQDLAASVGMITKKLKRYTRTPVGEARDAGEVWDETRSSSPDWREAQ